VGDRDVVAFLEVGCKGNVCLYSVDVGFEGACGVQVEFDAFQSVGLVLAVSGEQGGSAEVVVFVVACPLEVLYLF
jgi:hypothetical protein